MVQVEFDYLQIKTIIQSNLTDAFATPLQKYKSKTEVDLENKVFLVNGKNIEKTDIIENIMNNLDKQNKKIKILVNDIGIETNIN